MIITLDSGPLWRLCSVRSSAENRDCFDWLVRVLASGAWPVVPEVVDYEVRREVLRARNIRALARLDELGRTLGYLPLTTDVMRQAAELWASARHRGLGTGPESGLDVDVILAAQAAAAGTDGEDVVVATENPRHISLFVSARHWQNITIPPQ